MCSMVLVLVSELGHVDFALDTGGFASWRQVDRVAKETVAWHTVADHARHHLAAIYSDRNLALFFFQTITKKRE